MRAAEIKKELKAYVVREDGEGNCAIVFETNGAAARRNGGNELNLSFEEVDSCRREPAFDQYAPGPVPLHATLAAGWWHECCGCGVRFDQDERNYGDDEDREDEFRPVQDAKHRNFCSPACMMREWAERREREAREHAVIEACAARWPEATNIHAYKKYFGLGDARWTAGFRLPGLKHIVEQHPGDVVAYVSQVDAEEFNRLYGRKESGK